MASHGAPNAKVPTAPVIGAVTPKAGTSGVAPLAASPESLNPRMPPNNAMPEQGPMPPQGASKSTLNLLAPGSDGIETPEGPVVAVKQVSSGSAKRLPGNLLGMSSPVPFLRPMTLGAGGTPQLVGVPESWRLRLDTAGDRPLREPSPPRLDSSLHEPKAEPNSPAEALPTSAELQCGFLWYRPAWLQGFRTPGWVLGSLCAIEFTQSFVTNGVLGVVLPTIERRFSLSSYETGLILSSFNVVNGLFIVPVAFLGSTRNKPLIISAGMAITAAGSLMYFLAYALAPPYTYGAVPPDLCYAAPLLANETRDTCKEESIRDYRIFLFSGSMMHGAGVTPLHTLGISFLDENLPLKFTSLFVGTYSAMAVLGPAFGFLVAGYFLSVFVDLTDVSSLGLTTQSSVWVGAWWVGFLLAAILGAIVSVPMAAFPKHLPSYEQCQMVRRLHGSFKGDDVQYGQYVSDIPKAVLSLLKNVTFVLLILSSATEAMIGTAVMAFSVKFFEAEFALTPSATAATLGSILIPAGVGGTLLGGALTTKLDMKVRSMLKMCYAIGIVPWLCMWTFVLYCPTAQLFQGDARSSNRTINFIGKCNENCQCRTDLFDPICSVDNVTYMSPCYAGCAASEVTLDDYGTQLQAYKNCSCVPVPSSAPINVSEYDFEAQRIKCSTNCHLLVVYMIAIFICVFFTFLTSAPQVTVIMRCVEEKERAVGLAMKWVSIRLLGSIPAPLILGSVIDSSCLVWQEVCLERGACIFYNNEQLAHSMLLFLVPAKTASIALCYAANATLRERYANL